MMEWIAQHHLWTVAAMYWIFSAAVSALPDPAPGGSPGYLWLYRFSHTIAGNLTTVFGSRIPGLKGIGLGLIVPLLFSASACAAHYSIHPGALNPTDSAAYDALLIAESIIDQARLDYKSGQLPAGTKPALDALVESYNIARNSWRTYRGAISTNAPSDLYFIQLNQNLTDLASAIRALREPANASATARSLQEEEAK
jgi:hypothetical protein